MTNQPQVALGTKENPRVVQASGVNVTIGSFASDEGAVYVTVQADGHEYVNRFAHRLEGGRAYVIVSAPKNEILRVEFVQ
jgi:hypothetical protein